MPQKVVKITDRLSKMMEKFGDAEVKEVLQNMRADDLLDFVDFDDVLDYFEYDIEAHVEDEIADFKQTKWFDYEDELIEAKLSKLDTDTRPMMEMILENLDNPTKFQDPEIRNLLFAITQKL